MNKNTDPESIDELLVEDFKVDAKFEEDVKFIFQCSNALKKLRQKRKNSYTLQLSNVRETV